MGDDEGRRAARLQGAEHHREGPHSQLRVGAFCSSCGRRPRGVRLRGRYSDFLRPQMRGQSFMVKEGMGRVFNQKELLGGKSTLN